MQAPIATVYHAYNDMNFLTHKCHVINMLHFMNPEKNCSCMDRNFLDTKELIN